MKKEKYNILEIKFHCKQNGPKLKKKKHLLKWPNENFPGDPVAKTELPVQGSAGSIPSQGPRSHVPQLKILRATTNTPVQPNT